MKDLKKWFGEVQCDFCGTTKAEFFVDGKTRQGPWAFMCPSCWKINGLAKLGIGWGQKYNGQTLLKVEG